MAETPRFYDANARRRIRDTVLAYEAGKSPKTPEPGDSRHERGFWLARATEFGKVGDLVTFDIQHPDGNKGSETDSGTEVEAYIRQGVVYLDVLYLIVAVCRGSNASFEVLNPTTKGHGVSGEAIAQSSVTPGDILVNGSNVVEMYALYGDVEDESPCWWSWEPTEGFVVIQVPCPT